MLRLNDPYVDPAEKNIQRPLNSQGKIFFGFIL